MKNKSHGPRLFSLSTILLLFLGIGLSLATSDQAQAQIVFSGLVWNDTNQDGAWEWGELPIESQSVYVYNSDNELVTTLKTDFLGLYYFFPFENIFNPLPEGGYRISLCSDDAQDNCLPENYDLTTQDTSISFDFSLSFELGDGFNFGLFNTTDLAETVTVWPGDANNDGVVDGQDFLRMGIAYESKGQARAEQGADWRAYEAAEWQLNFFDSLDFVYADADGDGVVNDQDIAVVEANYERSHGKTDEDYTILQDEGYALSFAFPSGELEAGVALEVPITLDVIEPSSTEAIYGIAFTINYDVALVSELELDFSDSWFGEPKQDMEVLAKFIEEGVVDVAITGIDQDNYEGKKGEIGSANFVLADDIAGKGGETSIALSFSNIHALTVTFDEVPIAASFVEKIIKDGSITDIETILPDNQEDILLEKINILPNPAKHYCYIQLPNDLMLRSIEIFNSTGQLVYAHQNGTNAASLATQNQEIDISQLSNGLYLLRLQTNDNQQITKELIVAK